ncbi:transcription antiterminator [Tetragenococcus osmophilus]|uniref:Transcription antiterminator n=1 Tax=Tetragenococcus osmophilus TaxID=526944 RepID=A0AA38CWZ5_9ENTE|nr:PRD domain-containing protein [Tetragenococcus osmophilus]AYW48076.1 transcription antiterminator [Tetragenococcus osmophilus]GMA53812.1 transcriptional regulator [Alicyclobacillus contaminans]GMA72266.1 transcriptional regulator [Tetragenococcus osmophilus]
MTAKENREQSLLLLLSKQRDYITSNKLANDLAVSKKTIYRLVKKINENYPEGDLISSEKGRGYKLDYEKYISMNLTQMDNSSSAYSPEERRNRIMEELLLSSPKAKNVYDLFKDYYVGDSVIFNDEQVISDQLAEYQLKLIRKNRTLAIQGEEGNIRQAIADFIQAFNTVDIDELASVKESRLNTYDALFVLNQIKKMEKNLKMTLPYPYNINIFSHLYILITRSRNVGLLKINDWNVLTKEEKEQLSKDTTLYEVANSTITNIEQYLNRSLPEIEIFYLYQYLASSRMQSVVDDTDKFSEQVTQITYTYMEEMSEKLGISIFDTRFFSDLANHIKPMINRLKHKIRIKNGLLDEIKLSYKEIYGKVDSVSKTISQQYHLPLINEDENGFITLYFARVLETYQLPIKTLIVCTTGVGTSELLKAKIEKKFPELDVMDVVATKNLDQFLKNYPATELVLSTIKLKQSLPVNSLLVSAMLTADDQRRIQQKIEEINHDE